MVSRDQDVECVSCRVQTHVSCLRNWCELSLEAVTAALTPAPKGTRYIITCCCDSRPPEMDGTYCSHLAEFYAARVPKIEYSPGGDFFGFELSPNIGWRTAQQSSAEVDARMLLLPSDHCVPKESQAFFFFLVLALR